MTDITTVEAELIDERPMPSAISLLSQQRGALAQALADAVSYRDPPVYCDACDALHDMLCEQCAAMLARARSYLDLGRELGVEVPMCAGRLPSALVLTRQTWQWPSRREI